VIANDIIRRLRFALNLHDSTVIDMCKEGGQSLGMDMLVTYLKKEEEPGFQKCPDRVLEAFLDGLITARRGKKEKTVAVRTNISEREASRDKVLLSNNMILKKIRIALELREDDMLRVIGKGGMEISPGELTAIFRKPGHKHFRECKDQLLRAFLKGLVSEHRGVE